MGRLAQKGKPSRREPILGLLGRYAVTEGTYGLCGGNQRTNWRAIVAKQIPRGSETDNFEMFPQRRQIRRLTVLPIAINKPDCFQSIISIVVSDSECFSYL